MSTLSVHRLENVQDFDMANTPFVTAFNAANDAYAATNAAFNTTNTAYNFANTVNTFAYGVAVNSAAAFAAANNVAPQVTPAFLTGNLAYALANNAYDKANAANIHADAVGQNANVYAYATAVSIGGAGNNYTYFSVLPAYNTANAAYAAANTKFSSSGGTISGAVEINASLTVHGNTTFVDQTTLSVGDPLIYLAANNYASDVVDIGFIANYVNATSSNVHTGLFRSSGTKEYYLFQGYDKEPYNNYIDPTGNNITMAVLNSTVRTSNLILGGANTINWIRSGYSVANAAFGVANTALQNTSGTFAGSLTVTGSFAAGGQLRSTSQGGNFIYPADSGYEWWTGAWNDYVSYQITRRNTSTGTGYPYFMIDTTGNVGIGTTSPVSKLHVNGISYFDATYNRLRNPTYNRYRSDYSVDTSGTTSFNSYDDTGGVYMPFTFGSSTFRIITGNSGSTEAFYADASGRVGIGTTSPVNKLHVTASTQPDDANGLIKAEATSAANAVNASLTTKNWSGTSQFMQWENYGLRFGSRILTNYGAGNIYFTVGNDATAATLDTSSYLNVYGGVTTPILYDRNDTGYYCDPNSTSNLYRLTVANYTGAGSTLGGTAGYPVLYSVQQGSRSYEAHDFNTYPNLYSAIFCNISASSNIPTGAPASAMGYRFIMGAGDTTTRGFDLVGTSGVSGTTGELFFRERATGTWNKVWHNNNAPGTVLQVVTTLKTDQYYSTAGWTDITGMSASITPKSSSSKILVTIVVNISKTGGGGDAFVRLLRNGATSIGNGNDGYFGQHAGQDYYGVEAKCIQYLDSPGTTSSTSYVVQLYSGGGCYVNSRGLNADFDTSSSISLMEIAQ